MKTTMNFRLCLLAAVGASLLAACGSPLQRGALKVRRLDHMPMVYAPPGEFVMGSSLEMSRLARQLCEASAGGLTLAACPAAAFVDERPAHVVRLRGFWIDQTEVTNGMYLQCVEAAGCNAPLLPSSYSRPVYFAA